jgi:hypothetical protein
MFRSSRSTPNVDKRLSQVEARLDDADKRLGQFEAHQFNIVTSLTSLQVTGRQLNKLEKRVDEIDADLALAKL